MLDKRTRLLLTRIVALCDGGGYRIVEEGDLLSCFPPKLNTDGEGLVHMLRYLREHDYIDVKYAEEGVYCLSPLPEGRMYDEHVRLERSESLRKGLTLFVWTLVGAFTGAFAGAGLALMLVLSGGA